MPGDLESRIKQLTIVLRGGVTPAMITPLKADGYQIDSVAIARLIDLLVEARVKGIFVGGTTGEGILLDDGERRQLHAQAVQATGGRVPVLVHVGANSMATAVSLAEHAQSVGADAIAAVTPYFYPLDDDAIFGYYEAISLAAPEIPLLAYDIPQMAVNGISPTLFTRLIEEIPTLLGLKCSGPNAQIIRQLIDAACGRTLVLAGNEPIALGSLALGADGLISGLSTAVPELVVALTEAFFSGEIPEALRHQQTLNRVLNIIPSGARIGALKVILAERGIPVGGTVPPRPMPPVSWSGWDDIQALMRESSLSRD